MVRWHWQLLTRSDDSIHTHAVEPAQLDRCGHQINGCRPLIVENRVSLVSGFTQCDNNLGLDHGRDSDSDMRA